MNKSAPGLYRRRKVFNHVVELIWEDPNGGESLSVVAEVSALSRSGESRDADFYVSDIQWRRESDPMDIVPDLGDFGATVKSLEEAVLEAHVNPSASEDAPGTFLYWLMNVASRGTKGARIRDQIKQWCWKDVPAADLWIYTIGCFRKQQSDWSEDDRLLMEAWEEYEGRRLW